MPGTGITMINRTMCHRLKNSESNPDTNFFTDEATEDKFICLSRQWSSAGEGRGLQIPNPSFFSA